MGFLTAIIIIGLLAYVTHQVFENKTLDLHEEKAALQANLETTLDELEELDDLIANEEADKEEPKERPLRLLKKKIASKRHALKNTMDKVEVEGELNWEYRKVQAERTIDAARKVMDIESQDLSLSKAGV